VSTGDHLRVVTRALAQDRRLVLELGTVVSRAQAVNVDFRGAARRRVLERSRLLVRNLDRDRGLLDDVDVHAAGDAARARELALGVEHLLVRAREAALAFSRVLERGSRLDLGREPGLRVLVVVADTLGQAEVTTEALALLFARSPRPEDAGCAPRRRAPLWASKRVADLAVRFLPWEERQRYLDEYVSELDDLAQTEHPSGRAQLWHALRLLVRAPALRFALRAPAPEDPRLRSRAVSRLAGLITSRSRV
jgi:hypothetical protein